MLDVNWNLDGFDRPILYDTGYTSPNACLVLDAVRRELGALPASSSSSGIVSRVETISVEFADGRSITFTGNYPVNQFTMSAADSLDQMVITRSIRRTEEQALTSYVKQRHPSLTASLASVESRVEADAKKALGQHLDRVLPDVVLACDEDGWRTFFDGLYEPRRKRAIADLRSALAYERVGSINLNALIRLAKAFFAR